MQINIVEGIYTDKNSDFRSSLPVNLVPIIKETGISKSYLRPGFGIVKNGEGVGIDRGGINWDNVLYRVMDENLVSIDADGNITVIGSVTTNGKPVSMVYSFDRLAIVSNFKLFYYDKTNLTEVTSPNLGQPIDIKWIDGYFMLTDGEFLYVTNLNDPTIIDPNKYGSSELDPDPVVGLEKTRDEIYAMNRYTIEIFNNVGGTGFPFVRIDGAQIQKGALSTKSFCVYLESVAFVGSGRNEPLGVYIGLNSKVEKISTREIDKTLLEYTEEELQNIVVEAININANNYLVIHLPKITLIYDAISSGLTGNYIWFKFASGVLNDNAYLGKFFVWCYNRYNCGNIQTNEIGFLSDRESEQFGQKCGWEFNTQLVYNEAKGAIIHSIELVGVMGTQRFGENPFIFSSYSLDGITWSQEHFFSAGVYGERHQRIRWMRQGKMRLMRIQKFRGTSDSHISIAAVELMLEPLYA